MEEAQGVRHLAARLSLLAALACVPYLPFLGLPFITDDYGQIYFSRQYAPVEGWAALAADPLYRCRATSLFFTHWIDLVFGAVPMAHAMGGLLLHTLCTWMVYALGALPFIKWDLSLIAAGAFAVMEGHQEAVVWIAAQHEPLMFLFASASVLLFHRALTSRKERGMAAAGAAAAYVLALYSKESGVVALPALAALWLWRRPLSKRMGLLLLVLTALTIWYALAIFRASSTHQHLNDGTFAWNSPFLSTLARSIGRMLWFWGLAAGVLVVSAGRDAMKRVGVIAVGWMAVALLPYSFLAYMPRVPSRHTYLASAGLALLLAAGLVTLRELARPRTAGWALALCSIFFAHNALYLYFKKLPQYERRAAAMEKFVRFARGVEGAVVVMCAPFPLAVYQQAAAVALQRPLNSVKTATTGERTAAVFCDEDRP